MAEHGIGVREAARIAGVSPSTVSGWMSGTMPDNFIAVQKLAGSLGVTLSFLLTGIDDHLSSKSSVTEIFKDGGTLFDGFAKISIQRLIPRRGGEKID